MTNAITTIHVDDVPIEKMEKRRRVDGDFSSLLADLERRVRNG